MRMSINKDWLIDKWYSRIEDNGFTMNSNPLFNKNIELIRAGNEYRIMIG